MIKTIQYFAVDVAKLVVVPIIIVGSLAVYAMNVVYVQAEPPQHVQPRLNQADGSVVSVRSNLDDIY